VSGEDRPRIHWVSPLPPAETDIAHYTARLLPDLAARAEVVLWTDADAWDPALGAHAEIRRFDPDSALPMDMRGLPPIGGRPEAVFLHLGNNWQQHGRIVRLAMRVPGVAVLHDLALQDLMAGMMENGLFATGDYTAGMARWYGEDGARAARDLHEGRRGPRELIDAFPGFELALGRALAVLVHGGPAAEAAAARRALPVYRLALPFRLGPDPGAARARKGPLRLVQFGHMQTNRRLDAILEALAGLGDRVDFRFELMGSLADEAGVSARIRDLGLGERVVRRGFVEEGTLDAALGESHLVFNLRNPTVGEASGSQLRIWNAAAASVVSDHGWYATLPGETAFRVPPEGEGEALARLVRRIDRDRRLAERVGAAGRAALEARHGTDRYAADLVAVARAFARDAREGLLAERGRALLAAAPRPGALRDRLAALI
jgi:glycosyltransferase involved in cell wall biosynthesis